MCVATGVHVFYLYFRTQIFMYLHVDAADSKLIVRGSKKGGINQINNSVGRYNFQSLRLPSDTQQEIRKFTTDFRIEFTKFFHVYANPDAGGI